MNKYKKILVEKLEQIADGDEEFMTGVISYAETEENFMRIIEFIEQGIEVNRPNLTMLSLDLSNEGPQAYEKYWKVKDNGQR